LANCRVLSRVVLNRSTEFEEDYDGNEHGTVFGGCIGLIKLAAAAGFSPPEARIQFPNPGFGCNPPYSLDVQAFLLSRFDQRDVVLVALMRFAKVVDTHEGSEVRKFENARSGYSDAFTGGLLQCGLTGGGPKGVLGVILSYV